MAKADWDLGQDLIERGFCSLDQVREALSIQDRMKAMGVVPKPLPEILLEKGFVTAEQLREAGIRVAASAPAPKPARPRSPAPKRSPVPWFALAAVVSVLSVLLFFGGDILKALSSSKPDRIEPRPAAPSPSDAEKADQAAKETLDRVAAFAQTANDFENADEVVKRYAGFMEKHAGDKWELEANRRLQEYCARAEKFARPKLDEILKQEASLRDQGRLAELLRLLRSFPARFLQATESGRVVREKIAELSARQKEGYLHGKAEAEKLLGEKKFEAALDRVVALKISAPEDCLAELGDLQTRIDFEYKATTRKIRQEIADKYYEIDGRFKEALMKKPVDPQRAAAAVGAFVYAPWPEDQRPFVRVRGADYDALKKALDGWKPEAFVAICEAAVPDAESPEALSTAETALLQLRNAGLVALFYRELAASYQKVVESKELLDLPTLGRGHFEKKGEQTVFLSEVRGAIDPAKNPLAEPDLAYLAMRAGPVDAAAHARAGFFFYYTAPGFHERAYAHLVEAQKGAVKAIRPFLADLTVTAKMELARSLRVKFASAEDLFNKGQKVQAKKLLDELREQAAHPYVQEKSAAIDKMLFEITEGSEKEKKLALAYKGKGEPLEDGRARVTYDFSDKAQLEAFEFIQAMGARKFKGHWKLDRQALESAAEASVISWKPSVKGDVTLEYDLALLEDPQNIVVDLCYARGLSTHYSVVLGFDWVGKADGDLKNTKEDEYGMPRTCVIKYPVAVDKSRWVLAQEWDNWKSRLVGGAKSEFRPVKGKSYRMQIVRQGKAIRLLADKALVWEGEDATYTEGQILFFSDSRCRISNLSITFTPQ